MTRPTDAEVRDALDEMDDITRCRCHPGFKDRGLQDPDCHCDSAEAVAVLRAALTAQETTDD